MRQERSLLTSERRLRATSSIRAVLIGGFSVVFALWLVSGYELVRSMREVEQRMTLARDSFLRGEQVLAAVRTNILLGSIYLRDALMSVSPDEREHYRAELAEVRRVVDEALPAYASLVDTPREGEEWSRLQVELDRYWKSREVAFEGDVAADAAISPSSMAEIRDGLVSARESILEIVDSLSALERVSREHHEQEAAEFYAETQARVLSLAGLALVAGLVVAFVATRHVGGLQREIDLQRLAERQNRSDLERLSARLVNAQEEERRSLSRELHDAVGQALTAIKMEMGVALRSVEADSRARTALDQGRALAESTLQNVRDLSQLLHPSMLDDFGLPEALRAQLRGFSRRAGIKTRLTHEGMDQRLPAEIEVCVYRIVQEALTNVARHSVASSCTVSVIRRDDFLHLTVEDDGRGIGTAPPRAPEAWRGLGLIGMRERAQALAGTFVIESRSEGGTRVHVRLPLPARPAAPQQLAV